MVVLMHSVRLRLQDTIKRLGLFWFRCKVNYALTVMRRKRPCRQIQSTPVVKFIAPKKALGLGYSVLSVEYQKKGLVFVGSSYSIDWWEATYRGVALEGYSWQETFIVPDMPSKDVIETAEYLKRQSTVKKKGMTA